MTNQHAKSYTKLAIAMVLAAVIISASIFAVSTFARTTTAIATTTETFTSSVTAPSFSVEEYGPIITLDTARQLLSYNFTLPTYTPSSLKLIEMRGGEGLVYLIFASPGLPAVPSWDNGSVLVTIARDNTTYTNFASSSVIVITQYCSTLTQQLATTCSTTTTSMSHPSTNRTDVSVSGYPGWGYDSVRSTGQNGFLTWWDSENGLHYAITADLSLSTMVAIGQSMTDKDTISLENFYLVANGTAPGYQGKYLSGEIFVNASVPWSSYALYANNTYCGTRDFPNSTLTQFIYEFKGGPCVPVTVGDTSLIEFVVTFTDGSNASASTTLVAE